MSWRHNVCEDCWNKKNPGRGASRVIDDGIAKCCYCGQDNKSGIYVREDQRNMPCHHPELKQWLDS